MLVGSPFVPKFGVHSPRVHCEIGTLSYPSTGVPPFGFEKKLRIFIDPDLLQYDEVWAAAGTWNDVFRITPNDLVLASGGAVTDLKRA
jgi:prolyl-tRNA editing enzyme YbaK/EbsC (Cys-tRNA(Pro) deacylase)